MLSATEKKVVKVNTWGIDVKRLKAIPWSFFSLK